MYLFFLSQFESWKIRLKPVRVFSCWVMAKACQDKGHYNLNVKRWRFFCYSKDQLIIIRLSTDLKQDAYYMSHSWQRKNTWQSSHKVNGSLFLSRDLTIIGKWLFRCKVKCFRRFPKWTAPSRLSCNELRKAHILFLIIQEKRTGDRAWDLFIIALDSA